jgi:intracellular sulfur oxidation DsrE/DsrF family protein
MKKAGYASQARRSFLSAIGSGVTMFGAAGAAFAPAALAQSTNAAWQPKRHAQDDWFDQIPGQHRVVFDTTDTGGMNSAIMFSTNYYIANQSGYGLQNGDLAVVIVARHQSTPFAYSDVIWAKYGEPISQFINYKENAKTNPYAKQLSAAIARGTHFAVCQMASRALAGSVAKAVNATTDDVMNEFASNLLPNSHLVPAGIVAVARAQERGYAFVHAV